MKDTPCQWKRDECKHHRQPRQENTKPTPLPGPERGPVEVALASRDLRAVGWCWLERLTVELDPKLATPAVTWGRLIHALGDEPADREAVAAEAALFGAIMHGIPPRDAAQWEIVERTFDPETVKDLRRWRPNPFTLGEGEDPRSIPGWSEIDQTSDPAAT